MNSSHLSNLMFRLLYQATNVLTSTGSNDYRSRTEFLLNSRKNSWTYI